MSISHDPHLLRLDGKVALITGVGPGIGAHVARAYAAAGARVILAARTAAKLNAVVAEIDAAGGSATAVVADVGDKEELLGLVATAQELGGVDILFHNAAGTSTEPRRTTLDCTDEDWELAFNVNLLAPFRMAKALVPDMKRRGAGNIVNVLTTAAFRPLSPYGPYGATKAGLELLTRLLAKECSPEIRVNAICPGTISDDGTVREVWRHFLESGAIPMGRVGYAREVVGAALFLASDASSYTTGQTLFVDGGRVNTVSS